MSWRSDVELRADRSFAMLFVARLFSNLGSAFTPVALAFGVLQGFLIAYLDILSTSVKDFRFSSVSHFRFFWCSGPSSQGVNDSRFQTIFHAV